MLKDDERPSFGARGKGAAMQQAGQVTRRSPFRPSFGVTPPLVAGRDAIISEIADALESGPGAAGRAMLFTGNRGIGKTVMLNEAEAEARTRGWVVVSETATPCRTINGTPARGDTWTGPYVKWCGAFEELQAEVRSEYGASARRCGLCLAVT